MVLGFTGTQEGMTEAQKDSVKAAILNYTAESPFEAHHGDCIGADAEFHDICVELKGRIVIHPPSNKSKQANCWFRGIDGSGQVSQLSPKPYLERNHDIVDACDLLIATPRGSSEELRSGTWATIRYARKTGKRVHIIFPDGSSKIWNFTR